MLFRSRTLLSSVSLFIAGKQLEIHIVLARKKGSGSGKSSRWLLLKAFRG